MTAWTTDELDRVGRSEEIELASGCGDGTSSGFVTMWVVRVGDDLYVRSAGGPNRPWYQRAVATGGGLLRVGGVERAVTFSRPAAGVQEAIDLAYHTKYDHYGPRIVGSVVGPGAHDVTISLVPVGAVRS